MLPKQSNSKNLDLVKWNTIWIHLATNLERDVISMDERTYFISCILLELLSPHLKVVYDLNLQTFIIIIIIFKFLAGNQTLGEDLQYKGYLDIQLDN